MSDLPNIEAILQRQATFWEVRRRLAKEGGEAARKALVHLSEGPWITVSKELGSGGVELAHAVAGQLGWQVFDKQILSSIAGSSSGRETVLSVLDEHAIGAFNDYITQIMVPQNPGQVVFVREMMRVIWGLAKEGSAIILGRGANWFLKPEFGLRVRVTAPTEMRVAHVAKVEDLTIAAATKRVREHGVEQATFIRKVFGKDIEDPQGYDLILNLGALTPESAARITQSALRAKLGLEP